MASTSIASSLSLRGCIAHSKLSSLQSGKSVSAPQNVCARAHRIVAAHTDSEESLVSRRDAVAAAAVILAAALSPSPALAFSVENYTEETQTVIEKVRYTLSLDKTDPAKEEAVTSLRLLSNDWVAKYRREKSIAGKPSFSNMYSVLNAISGHYISFGPTYPIPKKRADRILEEVTIAEKALSRGR
eukprot:TRINITY_DN1780_c0_g1_i2.p1 TRINITY_DN1780_c0_g1~~TRINITY_DN1780_c0_g1_i2.p1  ORF type:complete len:186 (-),score=39.23 TRINITY_DN1780_c0_g1_i2:41-598(-)